MPDPAAVRRVAGRWAEKAEHDLDAAQRLLRSGSGFPPDAVCFHAQQCVEKYLKALLVLKGIPFGKTHDIKALLALLPKNIRPGMTPLEEGMMTSYAVAIRYPGESDEDDVTIGEARAASRIARRVRTRVRKQLSCGPARVRPRGAR